MVSGNSCSRTGRRFASGEDSVQARGERRLPASNLHRRAFRTHSTTGADGRPSHGIYRRLI